MGKLYDSIDEGLRNFILRQPVFFVATAPLSESGRINLSPKGLDSLRVLDDSTVAFADLTGSGVETIAHLKENSRIVLMFCAFEGPPKIVRLHGTGEVIETDHDEFAAFRELFPSFAGLRAVIRISCERISDSCGFGVPLMSFVGPREQITKWAARKGEEGICGYQREKNRLSIDGLPGLADPEDRDT